MSLKKKITFYTSMMLIGIILVSIVFIYNGSNKILQMEAERYIEAQLDRANENINLLLNNIVLETEKLSYDHKIRGFFNKENEANELNAYLSNLMEEKNSKKPLYMDLFLVNFDGIIVSAAMEDAIGVDVSNRTYFKDTVKNKVSNTSDIILSRADNTQIVITLTPTINEDNEVIGYTGIAIFATYFSDFLDEFSVNNKYIIIDSFDNIVSHSNKELISTKFDYFGYNESEFENIETVIINDHKYKILKKNSDFNNWKIISYLKDSEIYSESINLAYKFLKIGIGFIVLAIIFAIYITDVIAKPIVKITESINRIIEDEDNFQMTMLNNLPFEHLENEQSKKIEKVDFSEVSNLRKAIIGLKGVLEQGTKKFDVEYNKLELYIDNLYHEIESINNRNLDFITTLSHDIRTPLTLIKGYARGLESGEVTDNVMKQKFKSGIVQSVDDIENLVYNVLDFAYEVNFDYSYQIQKHDVNYVVEEIIFEINQLYSDYDKKINFKIDDFSNVDKHVNIDLMNIKRVIINLLNNSFKYTEMSDLIEMRIVNRNGLYFEIYDEGLGIRDENLLRIYELFYRTEDSKDKKGYGLGLYICNQILKNHGIELLCDSVYGEYTQMKFIIPFEEK